MVFIGGVPEWDGCDRAEPFEVERHVERIGVEADGHVELEACGDGDASARRGAEGDDAGGGVDRPAGGLLDAAERDTHGSRHRLRNGARPGLRARGVALHQLERCCRAVAGADRLIGGRRRARRQAGLVVAPVLEAEAVEPPVARLEEGDDRRQIVGAADAVSDIVAAARVGPAGITLLVARGKFDDLGPPLRPAARAATDVVGKPDLVKRHHMPLRPRDTARAISAATCVRDCRKLSASRAMMVTLTPPPPP